MATGDDATADGMDLVPGSTLANTIDTELNKTRDYIAQRKATILGTTWPVNKGGTGATDAAGARTNLGAAATSHAHTSIANGAKSISYDGVQWNVVDNLTASGNVYTSAHLYSPNMTAVVSGYVAVYRNSDGRIGLTVSSRRFKKEITAWSPDKQAVLALQLVTFRYKASVWDSTEEQPLEVGLIAEELHELGLTWLVFYDAEGLPQGIHYERLALALLPVIQDHEARLTALEGK